MGDKGRKDKNKHNKQVDKAKNAQNEATKKKHPSRKKGIVDTRGRSRKCHPTLINLYSIPAASLLPRYSRMR